MCQQDKGYAQQKPVFHIIYQGLIYQQLERKLYHNAIDDI
jgi:hypothetical protein